jgi:hypothetical protein
MVIRPFEEADADAVGALNPSGLPAATSFVE